MNIRSTFFLLFLALATDLGAARQREQFLRGNKAFEDGNVEQALTEYQEIKSKGPVLWYNIGACYYNQDNLVNALVAFKRAQSMADGALNATLLPLIDDINVKLSRPRRGELLEIAETCAAYLSLFWLQIVLLLIWWGYSALVWFKVSGVKKIKIGLILVLLLLASLTGLIWWVTSRDNGIVVEESTLFVGPNMEFHSLGQVEPAEEVRLLDHNKAWYKIKSRAGVGWVPKEKVEPIELQE